MESKELGDKRKREEEEQALNDAKRQEEDMVQEAVSTFLLCLQFLDNFFFLFHFVRLFFFFFEVHVPNSIVLIFFLDLCLLGVERNS